MIYRRKQMQAFPKRAKTWEINLWAGNIIMAFKDKENNPFYKRKQLYSRTRKISKNIFVSITIWFYDYQH